MNRAFGPSFPRGLSLLEPLVVVALLAALLVLGAPPLAPVVERAVALEAALRVHTAFVETRARALATHRCHRLLQSDDANGRDSLIVVAEETFACDGDLEGSPVRTLVLPGDVRLSTVDSPSFSGSGRATEAVLTVRAGATTVTVRILASGASCIEAGPTSVACRRLE
jgi:Tfp pilus assembly protein FimT